MLNFIVFLYLIAIASPTSSLRLGLSFDLTAKGRPILTLPYASYRAEKFNPDGDIYIFKNIRFAAPPVGDLRWAKPAPPTPERGIQDGSYGPVCIQAPIKGPQLEGPGADSPFGKAFNQFLAGIPVPSLEEASEDCLFLDIYVPKKAIDNPSEKLPVVSWFYGGAYIFGAKDQAEPILPFYDGTGLLQQSGSNVIFVASNYRMGAYGFLAGTTMEKTALPNAGLHDQRAALQWIQDYIGLVGGDKSQVSAWGLSAGAGSILHHLVAYGGTGDPLFSRAVVQSPAFQFFFDRKGTLEQTFQNFTKLAGCAGQGIACLRAASAKTLDKANFALNVQGEQGTFAVGPSPDGDFIRQSPALEFASGNYNKLPTSFIFSHVSNEPDLFIPPGIDSNADFSTFIAAILPSYAAPAGINAAIEARYPPPDAPKSNYSSQRARLHDVLNEAVFVCNVRSLSDAYKGKNYNIEYAVTPALHATDLLPTFYNLNLNLDLFGKDIPFPVIPGFGFFSAAYQSYLTSHARTGDPNRFKKTWNIPPAITWPRAEMSGDQDGIAKVLRAGNLGFGLKDDEQVSKERCGFWTDVVAAVTGLGGYAPPGSVVEQGLAPIPGDPSANYRS